MDDRLLLRHLARRRRPTRVAVGTGSYCDALSL